MQRTDNPRAPRRRRAPLAALACGVAAAVAMASCGEGRAPQPITALGVDLTVYDDSERAYNLPNPIVEADPEFHERYITGDIIYQIAREVGSGSPKILSGYGAARTFDRNGGLGPLFVGKSCTSCHQGAGRTRSTLFTHGGTGFEFSSFLVFMRTKNGQYLRDYGRVLHDHAIPGYEPEGRLEVEYTETCDRFPTPDAEEYCLVTPEYIIRDWYTPPFPDRPHLTEEEIMEELIITVRTPLRHVGLGLMLAVDPRLLGQLAATSYPEFNITPKMNRIYERGAWRTGLSGHKAHHYDLTVELGLFSDMGVTNPRYPEEVCEGQSNCNEPHDIEISSRDLADLDMYLQNTGVPARRNVDDPQVQRGEEMFYAAKCQLCHVPTLHTRSDPPLLIDGTPQPHLANQTFHPYTDYLLHDLGPELGDDFDQGLATGDEWRTAPLWGIGLQETVNGHTHFLHDARARNLTEAILWHGMEGSVSRDIFLHMPREDRQALLAFLRSL